MFILSILGLLITAAAVYGFIEWFNGYSNKEGRYRFFTTDHTLAYVASYLLIFFGEGMKSGNWHNDPLNGIVVMALGGIILFFTILNNFKKTKSSLAIKGTILQLILYVPITVVGLIVLLAAFAFFSQTKPVYVVNGDD